MRHTHWIRVMTAVVALTSSFTSAQTQSSRCTSDKLGRAAAVARLEWARRCGLEMNVISPASDKKFTTTFNGVDVTDYKESLADPFGDAPNVYTLQTYEYAVNSQYFLSLCQNVAPSQKVQTDGPLQGFNLWSCPAGKEKWNNPRRPGEPTYPSFGSVKDVTSGVQLFPPPALADCRLYKDKAGTLPVNTSAGEKFYPNLGCTAPADCNTTTPPSPAVNQNNPPPRAVPATLMPAPAALCTGDALENNQVQARLDWARVCSLMRNVSSPDTGTDTGIPASNGGTLKDYRETVPQGGSSYWGNLQSSEINGSYVFALFNNGPTSQAIQACGAANGYLLWSRPDTFSGRNLRRAQPMYPVYGNMADPSSPGFKQLFPSATAASCDLYVDKQGTQKAQKFYVVGYCMSPPP